MSRGILTSQGRFFGYIRDARAKRTQKLLTVHPALPLAAALPDQASLAQFRAPILDQGQTGSCTGHGSAQAIYTAVGAARAGGLDLPAMPWTPSPLGIYRLTRELERQRNPGGTLPPLTDSGAMPSDIMAAVSQFGVRPMGPGVEGRNSDCDSASVVLDEPFTSVEASYADLVVGEYRIDETAPDAPEQVCSTIATLSRPVGFGTFVDSAFMGWRRGDAPLSSINTNDPNGGGHWIDIDRYETGSGGNFGEALNGKRIFEVVNSWGLSAGDSGLFLVSEDWVRLASDLYAWDFRIKDGAS